jgi:chromate transporter
MIYLRLLWEFLKIGLFTFGGGMATVPFLQDLGERTAWFNSAQLADMIAVSESTPGPIGINMATYVGFHTAGVLGSVTATVSVIIPGFLCILILARLLDKFRESKYSERLFYGLRTASAGLISSALYAIAVISLFNTESAGRAFFNWKAIGLAAVIFALTNFVKPAKDLHPLVYILFSAIIGVIVGF